MKRLSNEQWKTIFNNIEELNNDNDYESVYGDEWVTVMYLDPIDESESKWGLVHDEVLFEEGFETEEEATERLQQLENEILGYTVTI